MKPTFEQMLRLIVCLAGITFFGVGVCMVASGISAKGVIDLKMEVLSGHLETGSAGAFIVFMSFFLIVARFLIGKQPVPSKAKVEAPQE